MKKGIVLSSENFENLLLLFSDNREEAGVRYEQIRAGLVRFFEFRGCADPISLADETINRVALKTDAFDTSRRQGLTAYFYGFAARILLEHHRRAKREISLSDHEDIYPGPSSEDVDSERRDECLSSCLAELTDLEREMIFEYYGCERAEKTEVRQGICERLQCTMGSLHTRIFRLKSVLRVCMNKCMQNA